MPEEFTGGTGPLRSTGGASGWTPPSVEHLQQLLVHYEILEIIGQGGMGAVYKGRQISLDRLVAIKILPPEALNQEGADDYLERFKNEARSMARMNHPGIVGVHDFGETAEGQLYLVMEHLDGTDVAKMILSQGRLPDQHALSITAHVCDALQYAHSHGVIHRDIKPANILLNREGQVKIADFGLAKRTEPGVTGITRTNMTMGTPDFIAPEALIEGLVVDHRSDLYSVGVMLYNMLTGEVPRGAFKMPSVKVGCDPRFDAIIFKAVQSEREERYQSAQDMRRDLDVILAVPMVKMEKTGPTPVPSRGISSKIPQRPASTGPKVATSAVPRPTSTGPKEITTGHKPAQGTGLSRATAAVAHVSVPRTRSHAAAAGNPALLYGGIAAVVAGVLGGGWWMLYGGGSKTTPASEPAAPSNVAQVNPGKPPPKPATSPSPGLAELPGKFTELSEVPHNQWFKVLSSQQAVAGKKNIEWKDGWITCRADSELLEFTKLGGSHVVRNVALKSLVRPPGEGKEWIWTFREGPHGGYRLVVHADSLGLYHDDRSLGTSRLVRLREGSFAKNVANTPQWSLEASIRGDKFTVSLNGQVVFSHDKLKLLEPGSCWLRAGSSKELVVKDVAFKVLDDVAGPVALAGGTGSPTGVLTFKNHRFQMIPDKLRWNEAKARAEDMGGHLATITSREENEWIVSTFIRPLPEGKGLWLGGTNAGTPTKWRWVTDEPFSFTNWAPGEPSNKMPETSLTFSRNDTGVIGWGDLKEDGTGNKDRRSGFLVEWDDQKMSAAESTILPAPAKWVDVTGEATSSTAPFKSASLEDAAGRLRFQGSENAQIHLRVHTPRFYRAMRTRDRLQIEVFDGQANKVVRQLAFFDRLPALSESAEHEMLFAVRGEILSVWMDGKYAGSAKDPEIKSGAAGYHLSASMKLKSLEFGDLGSGDSGATLASAPEKPAEKAMSPAASSPSAAADPAASSGEFEKRLAHIEAQFQAAYDRDVGRAHLAAVVDLDAKYVAALDRALANASKAGGLDDVLKLREEKQRISDKRPLPAEDPDALPAPLKLLRGTYRTSIGKLENERDKKAQPYLDRYDQLLDAFQKELTQQQKFDDAIKVKTLRVEFSAKRPKV